MSYEELFPELPWNILYHEQWWQSLQEDKKNPKPCFQDPFFIPFFKSIFHNVLNE